LGEAVAAAVVLQPGWQWHSQQKSSSSINIEGGSGGSERERWLNAEELRRHCREAGLSGFKLPRVLLCVPALPMNSMGKVLKQQVRSMLLESADVCSTHDGLGVIPKRSRL
jgi:acyl-coenzyme A synthetase/AMP-(fatty) acid ligase